MYYSESMIQMVEDMQRQASEMEKEVINGVFYDRTSLKEIAGRHGFSRAKAGQYQRAGLMRLRRLLQSESQDPPYY